MKLPSGLWFQDNSPKHLWCPECHYSEALLPQEHKTEFYKQVDEPLKGKKRPPESVSDYDAVINDEFDC